MSMSRRIRSNDMKKKLIYLLAVFLMVEAICAGVVGLARTSAQEEEDLLIVTSFYPVYLLTRNLTEGAGGVTVRNLTENHSGCIHDYQLTTEDMRLLEEADLFFINGGGMESFMEEAATLMPDLSVVSAGEGIGLIENNSLHVHGEGNTHDHFEEYNAHVWTDPSRYLIQIENLTNALCEYDPANEDRYRRNAEEYGARVSELEEELETLRECVQGVPVVLFHDAFVYLADALGMEIIDTVDLDADTSLAPGDLTEMIEETAAHGGKMYWEEAGVRNPAGEMLAQETGARGYELNPLTSGSEEDPLSAYLDGMRQNIAVIKEALADAGN